MESLQALLTRAFPADARERFARELLAWHLEELNGFGDRLRAGDDSLVRDRIKATVEALRWNREEVLRLVWELMPESFDFPEDAYAPALLLRELGADPGKLRAWLDRLPPEVLDALGESATHVS